MTSQTLPTPVVLVIGGFDGSAGAGVLADLKTVHSLGGYAISALTALTVQDHRQFAALQPLGSDWIRRQIVWLLKNYRVSAIKIGMLHDGKSASAVADALAGVELPIVLDPVLRSTSGAVLLEEAGLEVVLDRIVPSVALITPNWHEALHLMRESKPDVTPVELALRLRHLLGRPVLLKGGHLDGPTVVDLLVESGGDAIRYQGPRVEGVNGHGTGCRLASAIATGLGWGLSLSAAVEQARKGVANQFDNPALLEGLGPVLL